MKKLLVTSALPYANGPIHIGHMVEYIQTDIWVRYWKLRGRETIYVCADDTHGTPIMLRAMSEGITAQELIDRVWAEHQRDFAGFQIEFDNYYTTHSDDNRELSSEIFRALDQNGHITERTIEQSYCNTCKMFLPDRFIRGTCPKCGAEEQYGDSCEVCGETYSPTELLDAYCSTCASEPTLKESAHLFFKLGDFAEPLEAWVNGGHVQDEVANKLQEWFTTGLQDWDISRDAPYWGFEIPGNPGKYFYVWLDAPIGYMAATKDWCRKHNADFKSLWRSEDDSEVYHFIGKDIVYFHALFWPAMLMGSGFRTPSQVCVHGFLTVDGKKMSKRDGTFIMAETYLKHLDPQYLRYYYAAKLNSRVEDIDLNLDDFAQRVDADLVNKIANIPSRVLAILHKHRGGQLAALDEPGRALFQRVRGRCDEIASLYEAREFAQVTRIIGELVADINVYLQDEEPWQVVKTDKDRAAVACTVALNAYKVVATLITPILPEFGIKTARMLNLPSLTWTSLDDLLENQPVNEYERLVNRVDRKKIEAIVSESSVSEEKEAELKPPMLTLDGLVDCDFRTMTIAEATPVENADKLVKLTLKSGDNQRQVVAGLGQEILKEDIIGKHVVVLTNLEPRKLRGVESNGMVIAGDVDGKPKPLEPPVDQTPGLVE